MRLSCVRTCQESGRRTRRQGVPALSVVKGIEQETFLRPTQIVTQVLGDRPVAVLSGPNHAEETSSMAPASTVLAGEDVEVCVWIRSL